MNKARHEEVAIPEVAWKHVKVECGKVARRKARRDFLREWASVEKQFDLLW